jgi:8-oxo-dGTP pyrophosphatase MutT (NUDIX family)
MFRLIPAPLHRVALVAAHRLRQVWWRIRKPLLSGCRVLAFDDQGRVLLVRHSYGSGRWMLPGGGVGRREDPLKAALRELREEVGCGLLHAQVFYRVDEPLAGTTNRVQLICGWVEGDPRPDGREIVEAVFYHPAALPANMAAALEQGMADWVRAAEAVLPPRPAAD